jgi:hypothetical protein
MQKQRLLLTQGDQVKLEFKNLMKAGDAVSHSDDIFIVADKNRITQVL